MSTESANWGGARPGSGPRVRRIRLDDDTSRMLRVLSRQSGTPEQVVVTNLIRREYAELDQEYARTAQDVEHGSPPASRTPGMLKERGLSWTNRK